MGTSDVFARRVLLVESSSFCILYQACLPLVACRLLNSISQVRIVQRRKVRGLGRTPPGKEPDVCSNVMLLRALLAISCCRRKGPCPKSSDFRSRANWQPCRDGTRCCLGLCTSHPPPRLVTTKAPRFSSWRHLQKQFEGSGQCQ